MKINKFIYKIFVLFIIFYIISSTFVYADDVPSQDYDYVYNYKVIVTDEMQDYIDTALSSDYVFSGDYYYFIFATGVRSGVYEYGIFYVKKSGLISCNFSWNGYNHRNGFYSLNFPISCSSSNDFIPVGGYNGSSSPIMLPYTVGIFDSSSKTFTIPFTTNYPFDINYKASNGDIINIIKNSPYIADDDNTISKLNGSYFLIYPVNNSISNLHFSLCHTETVEGDFPYDKENVLQDFVLDSSSPFYNCSLGDEVWYEVPYNAFSSDISIVEGEEYNWRLQYDFDGKTYYVDRKIVSQVNYSFIVSGRW